MAWPLTYTRMPVEIAAENDPQIEPYLGMGRPPLGRDVHRAPVDQRAPRHLDLAIVARREQLVPAAVVETRLVPLRRHGRGRDHGVSKLASFLARVGMTVGSRDILDSPHAAQVDRRGAVAHEFRQLRRFDLLPRLEMVCVAIPAIVQFSQIAEPFPQITLKRLVGHGAGVEQQPLGHVGRFLVRFHPADDVWVFPHAANGFLQDAEQHALRRFRLPGDRAHAAGIMGHAVKSADELRGLEHRFGPIAVGQPEHGRLEAEVDVQRNAERLAARPNPAPPVVLSHSLAGVVT